MFFKKKQKSDCAPICGGHEFGRVMSVAKTIIKNEPYDIAKETLHYMMGCIKRDMQHEFMSEFWYKYPEPPIYIQTFIPWMISDSTYKPIQFTQDGKLVRVNTSKTCTVVVPWSYERIVKSVHEVSQNGFYESSNQTGYYYDLMDLCYLDNGNHHTAAAIIKHIPAIVNVQHYDIAKSFQYIYTDGNQWHNKLTGKDVGLVSDFRIGILYELTRLHHELKEEL